MACLKKNTVFGFKTSMPNILIDMCIYKLYLTCNIYYTVKYNFIEICRKST